MRLSTLLKCPYTLPNEYKINCKGVPFPEGSDAPLQLYKLMLHEGDLQYFGDMAPIERNRAAAYHLNKVWCPLSALHLPSRLSFY